MLEEWRIIARQSARVWQGPAQVPYLTVLAILLQVFVVFFIVDLAMVIFHFCLCWDKIVVCINAEVVREMYDKMFGSLEARTMPANAWLWSLVSNCSTKEDVTLLFKMLENLRIFVK